MPKTFDVSSRARFPSYHPRYPLFAGSARLVVNRGPFGRIWLIWVIGTEPRASKGYSGAFSTLVKPAGRPGASFPVQEPNLDFKRFPTKPASLSENP